MRTIERDLYNALKDATLLLDALMMNEPWESVILKRCNEVIETYENNERNN